MASVEYGSRAEVRSYAQENNILRLVDDLVDELLRSKPSDPRSHLVKYLVGQGAAPPAVAPLRNVSCGGGGVSFPDTVLQNELQQLWRADSSAFEVHLRAALPDEAKKVVKLARAVPSPKASAVKSPNAPKSSANVGIVQTEEPTSSKFLEDESRDERTATIIEASQKIRYCEESYRPRENVFQLAGQLTSWHLAGKKLWPKELVNQIEKNCAFMNKHHNYGEPLDVVVPLYLYTIHVFRRVTWGYWVRYQRSGRWLRLPLAQHLQYEKEYQAHVGQDEKAWPPALRLDDDTMRLLREQSKVQMLDEEKPTDDEAQNQMPEFEYLRTEEGRPLRMEAVYHGGRTPGDLRKNDMWDGLTLYGRRDAGDALAPHVFLARYEVSDAMVHGSEGFFPFRDTIAWVPPPGWFVEHTAPDTEGKKTKSTRPSTPKPLQAISIPPPGILEYLSARRAVENLDLKHGTVHIESTPVFREVTDDDDEARVSALIDRCFSAHNQQVFDEDKWKQLQKLLGENDNQPLQKVKKLIECKLGWEPGLTDDESQRPTPLQIVHALSIQHVVWSHNNTQQEFYAALSGPELWMMAGGEVCPMFRFAEEFDYPDQPYYYLNATIRNMQMGGPDAVLDVTMGKKRESFITRPSRTMGSGLGCLARASHSPALAEVLRSLRNHSVHTTLVSTSNPTRTATYTFEHADKKLELKDSYFDKVLLDKVGWCVHDSNDASDGTLWPEPRDCWVNCGYWMLDQVRPFLFYIDDAMKNMTRHVPALKLDCAPREGEQVASYRGLKGAKLDSQVYDRGNVFVWPAFSSTTRDMSVSQSYASGAESSCLFIMNGERPRNISAWSRFGREEEWLYPLNSMFQITSMLSEELRKLLGKNNLQIYEITEVNELDREQLLIRQCLASARSKEVANVLFAACDSVKSGSRVLDLALEEVGAGVVHERWLGVANVEFNALRQCPVKNGQIIGGRTDGDTKQQALARLEFTLEALNFMEGKVAHYTEAEDGKDIIHTVAAILGVEEAQAPQFVEVLGKKLKEGRMEELEVVAKMPTEKWEVRLHLHKEPKREGFAIGNDGAKILGMILERKIVLHRIDVRQNGINGEGCRAILKGLQKNKNVRQLTVVDQLMLKDDRAGKLGLDRGGKYGRHLLSVPNVLLKLRHSMGGASLRWDRDVYKRLKEIAQERCEEGQYVVVVLAAYIALAAWIEPSLRGIQPRSEPGDPPLDNSDNEVIYQQRMITITCIHNNAVQQSTPVTPQALFPFGSSWAYDAAEALYNVPVVCFAFDKLCVESWAQVRLFVYRVIELAHEEVNWLKFDTKASTEFQPPKYPKLPGLLVAAANNPNFKPQFIEVLLGIGCDPTETDEYGETAYLKLRRRLAFAPEFRDCQMGLSKKRLEVVEKGRYAHILESLHQVRPSLQPLRCKHNSVAWNGKNLALEMLRIVEDKDGGLIDEIKRNLVGAVEDAVNACAKVLKNMALMIARETPNMKKCPFISRIPFGQINSMLLLFKLMITEGAALHKDFMENVAAGEDEHGGAMAGDLRRVPPSQFFVTYTQFIANSQNELSAFSKYPAEEEQERRQNGYGLLQFKYEIKMTFKEKAQVEWERATGRRNPNNQTQRLFVKESSERVVQENNEGVYKKKESVYMTKEELFSYMDEQAECAWREFQPPQKDESDFRKGLTGRRVVDIDGHKRVMTQREYLDYLWNKAERGKNEARDAHRLPTLRDVLAAPSKNVFNPLVHGGYVGLQDSCLLLQEWAMTWLCTNGLLARMAESEQTLSRTLAYVSSADLLHHMNLQRGQEYTFPDITLWRQEAACEVDTDEHESSEYARGTLKEDTVEHSIVNNEKNDAVKDDTLNAISFMVRGRVSCAKVGALNRSDDKMDVLLPSLTVFTVEDVSISKRSDGASTLLVKLISRGSVFRDDNEVAESTSRLLGKLLSVAEDELTKISSEVKTGDSLTGRSRVPAGPAPDASAQDMAAAGDLQHAVLWSMSCYIDKGLQDKDPLRRCCRGDVYFGADAALLPVSERMEWTRKHLGVLEHANAYAFCAIRRSTGGSRWNHDSLYKDGSSVPGAYADKALPFTYRPAFTLLHELGRRRMEADDDNTAEWERDPLHHVPWIEFTESIMNRGAKGSVTVSAETIRAAHEANRGLDARFNALGATPPTPEEVYGDQEFHITLGQCQQFIKSSQIQTGENFPDKFFKALVGTFTGKRRYALFFKIFRVTSLIDIAEKWDEALEDAITATQKFLNAAQGRLADAVRDLAAADAIKEAQDDKEKALLNNRNFNVGKKYRNEVIVGAHESELKYLMHLKKVSQRQLDDVSTVEETGPDVVVKFQDFVHRVQHQYQHYGFTSRRHAELYLRKSLIEMSTEVCVSQQGLFLTAGVDENHNQLCTNDGRRPVTFLMSPAVDFCFDASVAREAPKYFQNLQSFGNPRRWEHFKEGAQEAFKSRVKDLFLCIFQSAKKQGVRHISMLPIGLGQFLDRVAFNTRPIVTQLYFCAQFELLSEQDFGFECYWLSLQPNMLLLAQEMLNSGLVPHGKYNNRDNGIFLRCNIIFHDKDAKSVAGYLASQGQMAAFMNPSDSQAVFFGTFGMYWEEGRSWNYVGEEDWAATSTGCLSWYSIAAKEYGFVDEHAVELEAPTAHSVCTRVRSQP